MSKSRHLLCMMLLLGSSLNAQELGYVLGVNKIGINPGSFQPLYGMSLSKVFSKYLAVETACFYSQRLIDQTPQADYLSFALTPQWGYFDKNYGVYLAPALMLNPTLYHSNLENHTYLSSYIAIGGRKRLAKKIILDAKAGYDIGLTGGYYLNNYSKYSGVMLQVALKFDLSCQ